MASWADDPETLLRHLEESPEGCLWLLERWGEFRNLLDRKTEWETPVMRRFIRLQGKNLVESVYDPALNAIFLAWDVLRPGYAKKLWGYMIDGPCTDPAVNDRLRWREITDRPADAGAAWASLYAMVDDHVGRLKEVLAAHEAMGITGDPDWVDRAALEGSPAFERHRRKQSALHRELMQTLDALRKMRNVEFGTENEHGKGGKRPMTQGERQIDPDRSQMGEDKGHIDPDQCQMAEDKGQISRHEFRMAEDKGQTSDEGCQGADEEIRNGAPEAEVEVDEKSLPESVTTARKLQNKANSDFADLKQEKESQEFRSGAAETGGREQSQFPGGCRTEKPGSPGGRPAPRGGQQPEARDMVLDELLAAAAPPLPSFNQPSAPGQTAAKSGSQRLSALNLTLMLARLPR